VLLHCPISSLHLSTLQVTLNLGHLPKLRIAFQQIFSSLSAIVSQFENLSAFAAGVERLHGLADALETRISVIFL
jgi:ABC-type uncharacterized transport system fused permease/ATPase subunit